MPTERSRLRLLIVGDGPLRAELERKVAGALLADQCWITGARDDIDELVRAMDVFVLSSLNEGISNTILEAMASGVAVVATRVGGTPELVADGDSGMLVPPAQPAALAQALQCYAEDRSLARRHGQAGRRIVDDRFRLETMVDRHDRLYQELLATHLGVRLHRIEANVRH